MSGADLMLLRPIPFDVCHLCVSKGNGRERDALDTAMYGLGLPVAVSEVEQDGGQFWMIVRYVCPRCRAVWDMSHGVEMEGAPMGRFVDQFLYIDSAWTAPEIGGTPFPAGPSKLFIRQGARKDTER
jgi:hypothetical protein